MKNKWIKDKKESLKNQTSDNLSNLSIQPKESVRHIKNNIENNKEVEKEIEKIDTFSDFLIYIIRKVTMKYNLCCKLWSGLTPLEVKTNLNGDFITISDVLLKQVLLKLSVDNQLVFRTVDKDTDFFIAFKINWLYQEYETICNYYYKNQGSNKNCFELQKDVFLESCIFPQIKKDWNKLIFRSTSC